MFHDLNCLQIRCWLFDPFASCQRFVKRLPEIMSNHREHRAGLFLRRLFGKRSEIQKQTLQAKKRQEHSMFQKNQKKTIVCIKLHGRSMFFWFQYQMGWLLAMPHFLYAQVTLGIGAERTSCSANQSPSSWFSPSPCFGNKSFIFAMVYCYMCAGIKRNTLQMDLGHFSNS